MTRTSADVGRYHDVVVVGGGNAGVSLAARLRRDGAQDVALVDPNEVHRYRPLLNYVGGGQAPFSAAERAQANVIPDGVHWYRDRVVSVDAGTRSVRTSGGRELTAGDLVLCPGIEQDWDAIPGSREAVFSSAGASTYVDERAEHTWELVGGLRSGRAVFVVDDGPIGCAGAALKPLFLAADHWRREGVLDRIDVTLVLGWDTIFGIERVDVQLARAVASFGIRVVTRARIERVDAREQSVTVASAGVETVLGYDLLHLVPRHRAPAWVAASDLAGPGTAGMIEISPTTLAHRRHPAVWGLGDAADVQASRSGGALRKQAAVVADNIARRRRGRPLVTYNGYTTAPIAVARHRLVLAEFDREGRITPSVPLVDLVKARRFTWFYDRYLQPQLYWHSILKGRIRR
jgi:sulfide:quinone oxidoreductase